MSVFTYSFVATRTIFANQSLFMYAYWTCTTLNYIFDVNFSLGSTSIVYLRLEWVVYLNKIYVIRVRSTFRSVKSIKKKSLEFPIFNNSPKITTLLDVSMFGRRHIMFIIVLWWWWCDIWNPHHIYGYELSAAKKKNPPHAMTATPSSRKVAKNTKCKLSMECNVYSFAYTLWRETN